MSRLPDTERSRRLVEDHDVSAGADCACDGDDLALPTGKHAYLRSYGGDRDVELIEELTGLGFHAASISE